MYKIYCLINPFTMLPFYVGATKLRLELRLQGHISNARTFNYKLTNSINLIRGILIKSIYNNDSEPIISLLCEVEKLEVDKMERFYYEKFTSEGIKLLQSKHMFIYQKTHDKPRKPRSELPLNNFKEYKAMLKREKMKY